MAKQSHKNETVASEITLKMYFNKNYLNLYTLDNLIHINITYGVYESNNFNFYSLCKSNNYAPEEKITEIDKFGGPIEIE